MRRIVGEYVRYRDTAMHADLCRYLFFSSMAEQPTTEMSFRSSERHRACSIVAWLATLASEHRPAPATRLTSTRAFASRTSPFLSPARAGVDPTEHMLPSWRRPWR